MADLFLCNLEMPAVAGIARSCYQQIQVQKEVSFSNFTKQFMGALVCTLMEANGFRKTGRKKAIPHPMFTKGEFYVLAES